MSALTEALARFWDKLRTKSRVRIERPYIPQALQEATGELNAKLWKLARQDSMAVVQRYRLQTTAA
jgi:23S rRNA maturation-related 3'-5' exoribonuclease YhaM